MSFWMPDGSFTKLFRDARSSSIPTVAIMSATVFVIFSAICWVFISSNDTTAYPKRRLSELYSSLMKSDDEMSDADEQPLVELVLRFRALQNQEEKDFTKTVPGCSSWSILKLMSRKLKDEPSASNEAAELNLHSLTLGYVLKILPTTDHKKVTVAIELINNLLQNPIALNSFRGKKEELTSFVDNLLEIIKMYLTITDLNDNDEDHISTVTEDSMVDFFAENGYKFILALGLLVVGNSEIKSVCADRGFILTVLNCLKQRKYSSSLSKWCIWAIMNITFEHPPNKSIFVHKGGLTVVMASLRHHAINSDVQKQGLALLFVILTDDTQSKFHIKDARKTALALGIITIIEAAQINFKGEKSVQDPCAYLLEIMAGEVEAE